MNSLKMDVGSKTILFHQFGCLVGYGDDGVGAPSRAASGMGGNPSTQAEFVGYMFNVFISDPALLPVIAVMPGKQLIEFYAQAPKDRFCFG